MTENYWKRLSMGRLIQWSIQIASCMLVISISSATSGKCIDGERKVLLEFKLNVPDENDYLRSWGNPNGDCCRDWDGVGCDELTGHVIEIDLHGMYLSAKVRYSSIPFIDELPYLKSLNLIDNPELLAPQNISSSIGNRNNHSFAVVSLQHLKLRNTALVGTIPEDFGNTMPALTHLDLSLNMLQGSIPEDFGHNMLALTHLDLSSNSLGGSIPENFGNNMLALTYLDLSKNRLQGSIPETLGKIVKLTFLDLRMNGLEGHIPEALGNMSALEALNLGGNRLTGEIPKSIWNICTLRNLTMDSNRLNGSLTVSTLCPNHPLQQLYLHRNRITGLFPDLTIFPSLAKLSLAYNLLDGVISEHHFVTLSKLRHLGLSSNNFTFNVTSAWLPPFQLETIALRSCKLGPKFPIWLRTQVNYRRLDISNSGISDSIPSWFWNTTKFMSVNASHNKITGTFGNGGQASINANELDMSFNKLEGAIPIFFFNVKALYLSQNKFTDLNSLCDVKAAAGLKVLDISFNQLSGTLPDCWSSLHGLVVLNLANNDNLSGSLPTSIGLLASLKALHLEHNNFTGTLPPSMKNCSSLVALQMGHNNLFGPIPDWVGENPKQLAILVLRSNHFNASVPRSLCRLQSLQLLDLSLNHISGTLPNCLSNLTKMAVHEQHPSASISYFITGKSYGIDEAFSPDDETIDVVWKGKVTEFRSTLRLVKSIDLSSNMLNGEVPTEISSLVGLVSLNLSRNNLMGQIPLRIGNLANLDSLDLSNNHLSGSIPQSLGLIYGISVLNVSNNNLSGKIPKGTQLQSFNASAYIGNPELCGDPLPNICPGEEPIHRSPPRLSEKEEDGASNREETNTIFGGEFYASMVIGYAVGFLGVVGTILFNRSCRSAYFKVLQDVANWAYVVAAIHKAKFVRRIGG